MIINIFFVAIFLVAALGLGKRFGTLFGFNNLNLEQNVAIGIGVFQVTYLTFCIIFMPLTGFYLQFLLCLFSFFWGVKSLKFKPFNKKLIWSIGIGIILLSPLFARLISPPISTDGVSFYLPNIEWVFNNGIEFNPYITTHTTMPLGAERLFAFFYGINQISAVRTLDASFALLLLILIFKEAKRRMNFNFALVSCLIVLLIPGTFIWNFGTGKVDTISTYLFLIGFFTFVNRRWFLSVFILSITLNIKYTNWILLCLPIAFACIMHLYHSKNRLKYLVLFIPVFFCSISLVKNIVSVNNPLAPLINIEAQNRFVQNHGNRPTPILKPKSDLTFIDEIAFQIQAFGIFNVLHTLIFFLLIFFIFFKKSLAGEYKIWLWFLFLSSLIWFYLLGSTLQPLRFFWGNLIIITLAVLIVLFNLIKQQHTNYIHKIILGLTVFICTWFVFSKKGHYFSDYYKFKKGVKTEVWYNEIKKHHYAISVDIASSNINKNLIYFHHPIALGLLTLNQYDGIPFQEDFIKLPVDEIYDNYQYILCKKANTELFIQFDKIRFERGDYVLLEKQQRIPK